MRVEVVEMEVAAVTEYPTIGRALGVNEADRGRHQNLNPESKTGLNNANLNPP